MSFSKKRCLTRFFSSDGFKSRTLICNYLKLRGGEPDIEGNILAGYFKNITSPNVSLDNELRKYDVVSRSMMSVITDSRFSEDIVMVPHNYWSSNIEYAYNVFFADNDFLIEVGYSASVNTYAASASMYDGNEAESYLKLRSKILKVQDKYSYLFI